MKDEIKEILTKYKTIAIVGLSDKPDRDSYIVAEYLLRNGYKIIPVNPNIDSVFGLKAYPDLLSVPDEIDIVDIFRRPEFVEEIVDQAIQKKAKVVWMQLGVLNEKAAKKAQSAGLKVVMNKCIKVEHMYRFGDF
ncbi:MAG: CoA-binding protein [Candidatus Kryptonium sp.]|nr:CoA-binding protein [Candidatus Kryptonium sp.]MCX7762909.1 CoA-binding protein [Candidatus Kryptonium sp.]MDW8109423.1 CoA-binding protein [Candidatus Kryptonium sp.]